MRNREVRQWAARRGRPSPPRGALGISRRSFFTSPARVTRRSPAGKALDLADAGHPRDEPGPEAVQVLADRGHHAGPRDRNRRHPRSQSLRSRHALPDVVEVEPLVPVHADVALQGRHRSARARPPRPRATPRAPARRGDDSSHPPGARRRPGPPARRRRPPSGTAPAETPRARRRTAPPRPLAPPARDRAGTRRPPPGATRRPARRRPSGSSGARTAAPAGRRERATRRRRDPPPAPSPRGPAGPGSRAAVLPAPSSPGAR